MMFDLTGMTALVTGASGGLGSAIAKSLAAQGARLALSGSNQAKLEAFAKELGGDHVTLVCNLSNAEEVDQLLPHRSTLPRRPRRCVTAAFMRDFTVPIGMPRTSEISR